MLLAFPAMGITIEQVGAHGELLVPLSARIGFCMLRHFPYHIFYGVHLHPGIFPEQRNFPTLVPFSRHQVSVPISLLQQIGPIVKFFQLSCIRRQRYPLFFEISSEFIHAFRTETACIIEHMLLRIIFINMQTAGICINHHFCFFFQIGKIRVFIRACRIAFMIMLRSHQPSCQDIPAFQGNSLKFFKVIPNFISFEISKPLRKKLLYRRKYIGITVDGQFAHTHVSFFHTGIPVYIQSQQLCFIFIPFCRKFP